MDERNQVMEACVWEGGWAWGEGKTRVAVGVCGWWRCTGEEWRYVWEGGACGRGVKRLRVA